MSITAFPPISTDQGLILSGKIPFWLVTAVVRLYQSAGLPWIACYHPQLEGAVIIYSRTKTYAPGDIILMPT